ncbi:MAG TPA: hypothetical protein VFU05_10455 [Cyclobacteriaceae bacterium]|nr:hypothetical protein [Cyclobacteriaceae bacterium]
MTEGIGTKWNSGELTFHDGTKLRGMIRFNEISKLISFKENTDSRESKSFKENKVFSMSFTDSIGTKRNFYSFEYKEGEILLFEILREFKDWAVLSRKEMVQVIEGKNSVIQTSYGPAKNNRAVLVQEENTFVMDQDGNFEKFHSSLIHEKDGIWQKTRKNNSSISEKILEKFMHPNFDDVKSFARLNKLNLEEKGDLLIALDYYKTLLSKD